MKWLEAVMNLPILLRWAMGLMGLTAIALVIFLRVLPGQSDNPIAALTTLEQQIHREYPTVNQVSPTTAQEWLRHGSPPPLVLDIREPQEYQVSHLPQAINVPPAMSVKRVMEQYLSTRQPGQKILVYCSVGVRSSRYAQQLQGIGVENIYNLQGSIFAWANQGFPVQRQGERVHTVHGYDAKWEKYLLPQYRSPLDE
jgi:rhodanese-related sulfurtransferase